MSNSPVQQYQEDILQSGYQKDPAQAQAVEHLQRLYELLVAEQQKSVQVSWGQRLWSKVMGAEPAVPLKGLYFWGGVGRGKTYLMDVFFETLPFDNKMRTHFHRFMRKVHHELKGLKEQSDPLEKVAQTLADQACVICFDEFFVSDITDAMILANLLDALFKRGVVLVATSNIEPSGLYKDGLQRARFLPAIDLLYQHTQVVNVDGGIDYRLRALEKVPLFHTPLGAEAHVAIEQCFNNLVPEAHSVRMDVPLEIEGREIRAVREAEDVVWFTFEALCDGPRSQNDYIELAREYHAVIVEGVPTMGAHNDDQAKRFIYLVDEFYDRNVKLVLSAANPMLALYGKGRAEFEFQRTLSRLQEMQSEEYLARPHKP